MGARWCVLAPVLLLFIAASAVAESWELRLGLGASGNYNPPTKGEAQDDRAIVNFGPQIAIHAAQPRYRVSVEYAPQVRFVATTGWAHTWDHRLSANAEYNLGQLTILSVNDVYEDISIYNFENGINPDGTVDVNQSVTFERARRNNVSISLQHFLAPRWILAGTVAHGLADFAQESRSNSQTVSGAIQISHIYSRHQEGGVGVSSTYSMFDESTANEAEQYANLQVFASWQYRVKNWLRFKFRGGPALQFVKPRGLPDQQTPVYYSNDTVNPPLFAVCSSYPATTVDCNPTIGPVADDTFKPQFDTPQEAAAATQFVPVEPNPSSASTSITFFGRASVVLKWDEWEGEFGVRRVESNQSGEGPASVVTGVSLRGRWQPDPYWALNLAANWSLREQIGTSRALGSSYDLARGPADVARFSARQSVGKKRDNELTQYFASFGIWRRLTDHLSASATASFVHQERKTQESTDRYSVRANLAYSFDPITF